MNMVNWYGQLASITDNSVLKCYFKMERSIKVSMHKGNHKIGWYINIGHLRHKYIELKFVYLEKKSSVIKYSWFNPSDWDKVWV